MKWMRTMIRASVVLGASVLIGCNDKASMTEFFGPEDSSRRVHQAANAQANNGAKEDAALYGFHFTGGRLNSLGAAKLARLVPDDGSADVNIYLDVKENDLTAQRKQAIAMYLHACGVDDSQLKLAVGPNPSLSTPSASGLARLSRTDSATAGATEDTTLPSYSPQGMEPSQ